MATFCRVLNGGALVTACTAPTQLTLSANNVGFGQTVTLSWSGAQGGAGNPIAGYEVYRDGALLQTVQTASLDVQSPAQNGSYTFTVRTKGTIPGFDSPVSTASAVLTSLVTACTAPTQLTLSANNVGFGQTVTLSWTGVQGGTNNPIAGYQVYRDGVSLGTVTQASMAVQSPAQNGSYTFTVRTKGTIPGFDSPVSVASATLTSLVTAPATPASVWLSAQDVKLSGSATLSWSAAAGGTNNPVAGYAIYRGGAAFTTVAAGVTTLVVTAPATDGASYAFAVKAKGAVAGFDSAASAAVTLTAHAPQHVDSYFTASGTYTVPWWAERVDVTCIGGGASGTNGGWSQGGETGCPGGGGGSGYIGHWSGVAVSPGAAVAVTVGAGGSVPSGYFAVGKTGGTSKLGSLVSANGGNGGPTQGNANSSTSYAAGGNGGFGGGGGARSGGQGCGAGGNGVSWTAGSTYGGGRSASNPSLIAIYALVGGGGAMNGTNGTTRDAKSDVNNGGVTTAIAQTYAFQDASTARYLGPGGRGGSGNGGFGGYGGYANGRSGTAYGTGGTGGGVWGNGAAGVSGLVAVRAWRYL